MKPLVRSFLVIAAASALLAPSAHGQTEQLKFIGGSGVGFNGVQVGPYRGMLLSEPGTPTIDIYCVDYLHEITLNAVWTANESNLAGNLSKTRLGEEFGVSGVSWYGTDDVLTRYRKAAWLTTQFAIQNTSAWGGIHSAIWLLTTPNYSTNLPSAFVSAAAWWIGQANANYLSIDPNSYVVLTDVNTNGLTGGVQEYLMVTPEPQTIVLLGSGFAALYAAHRRRRQQVST